MEVFREVFGWGWVPAAFTLGGDGAAERSDPDLREVREVPLQTAAAVRRWPRTISERSVVSCAIVVMGSPAMVGEASVGCRGHQQKHLGGQTPQRPGDVRELLYCCRVAKAAGRRRARAGARRSSREFAMSRDFAGSFVISR
jgi:hypothetical protein